MNQFPPSPRVFHLDRFKFFQQYQRQICFQCQQRRWQITTGINDTDGKFATGVNNTGGKQWEQLPKCWQIKINFKKIIYMLTPLPKRVQKKWNHFSDWRFFPFATGVNHTSSQPWAANIFANFQKKFDSALMVYSVAWGKLIHEKNQKQKILWHCPFKYSCLTLSLTALGPIWPRVCKGLQLKAQRAKN